MNSKYEVINRVGKGGYASVYKIKHKASGDILAAKKYLTGDEGIMNLIEIDTMHRINHPNIISSIGMIHTGKRMYVFMPLGIPLKSIQSFDASKYIQDLVSAVVYLHSHGIYHCDIKPDNMISVSDTLVLIDFNISTVKWSDDICPQSIFYSPPEYLYHQLQSKCSFPNNVSTYYQNKDNIKSDYWALGVSIVYLLTKNEIFYASSFSEVIKKVDSYLDDPIAFLQTLIDDRSWIGPIHRLMHPCVANRSIAECISLVGTLNDGVFKIPKREHSMSAVDIERFNILSGWLYEVIREFKLSKYCYIGCLDIIIRYFKYIESIKEIQLVGITALFMMHKVIELYTRSVSNMTGITDNTYTIEQILECEINILKKLEYIVFPFDILTKADTGTINQYIKFDKYVLKYWME